VKYKRKRSGTCVTGSDKQRF